MGESRDKEGHVTRKKKKQKMEVSDGRRKKNRNDDNLSGEWMKR